MSRKLSVCGSAAGLLVLAVCSVCKAESESKPRTISVSGFAEVKVVPDEVAVTLGVTTLKPTLAEAKREHDAAVKKVLALGPAFKFDPKDVQTDYVRMEAKYESRENRTNVFVGYEATQTMLFVLKDLSKYEAFVTAALEAGANSLEGATFRTSELRKHRDQARNLALKAAQEKANAMAGVLGQRVGMPLDIEEVSSSSWFWTPSRTSNYAQVAYTFGTDSTETAERTIALGAISVEASVKVTFALIDAPK